MFRRPPPASGPLLACSTPTRGATPGRLIHSLPARQRRRRSEGEFPRLTSLLSTGTFITEWKEGGQLCEAFLAGDDRSYQAVADRLVLMAQFLHFDGWLINIENSLSVSTAFLVTLAQPGPGYHGVSPAVSSSSPRPHPGLLPLSSWSRVSV